ncbi:MAG: NAD(P)-binding domain-containing protein [Actinomycetota bacterium]|nr:NAD(P)-binding domain-containing protein [Actinomycetota bacterium]
MARALARGWGAPVLCSDNGSGRAAQLVEELGGEAFATNVEVAERADLVVLCHKPAGLEPIAHEIAGDAKAVASVLGATSTGRVQAAYPDAPVFRMMPNTAVEVRRGVVCYVPAGDVDPALEAEVIALFARLGRVVALEERYFAAATAVMGVGPAYQALLAESQVDAAVRHGLRPQLAAELVTETMAGTAELLAVRGYDTLAVRREVTSPGGSTARGLAALERAGVRAAFQDAIDAVIEVAEDSPGQGANR